MKKHDLEQQGFLCHHAGCYELLVCGGDEKLYCPICEYAAYNKSLAEAETKDTIKVEEEPSQDSDTSEVLTDDLDEPEYEYWWQKY